MVLILHRVASSAESEALTAAEALLLVMNFDSLTYLNSAHRLSVLSLGSLAGS